MIVIGRWHRRAAPGAVSPHHLHHWLGM